MLKLKLYLFLGKFIKWFKKMASNSTKKLINSEILQYLNRYQNKEFRIGEPIYLPHATSLEINISFAHKDIHFSFSLEYIKGSPIEKSIIMPSGKFTNEFKMISDYFEYFKDMPDSQLVEFFKHLK
jgi:hypothetical protein